MAIATTLYAPDGLTRLRESFALHLDATRASKTARIYLDALDNLIAHLARTGMPTAARAVRREHVESYLAARRDRVAPSTPSLEYRALGSAASSIDFALPGDRGSLRAADSRGGTLPAASTDAPWRGWQSGRQRTARGGK